MIPSSWRKRLRISLLQLSPAVALCVFWEIGARSAANGLFRFGAPSAVFFAAREEMLKPTIYLDFAITTAETVCGLILGSAFGSLVGLSFWVNSKIGRMSQPYVTVAGAVPVFALAPLLINWFGIGFSAKVIMASFSTFLVSLSQAYHGAKEADADRIEFAVALRATRVAILRRIIIPGAAAWVLAGMRLNVGFAMLGAFIAEFISSDRGLGRFILRYGGIYDIPRVLLGVMLLGAMAILINAILSRLARRWIVWRESEVEAQ